MSLDLIAVRIYDNYSVGLSFRPICTRCCFTTTYLIQVCSKFHRVQVFVIHTRQDEIRVERVEGDDGELRLWHYMYVCVSASVSVNKSYRNSKVMSLYQTVAERETSA